VAPVIVILKANTHAGRFYFVPVASADMPSYATDYSKLTGTFIFDRLFATCTICFFLRLLSFYFLFGKTNPAVRSPKLAEDVGAGGGDEVRAFAVIFLYCRCALLVTTCIVACCVFALQGVASLGRRSVRHVPRH
jgi:hypothetical protein